MLKFKNPFNFAQNNMDEGKCFEEALALFTEASVIYKRRNHAGGAVQCLQNMSLTYKKLGKPFLHLKDETMKLRR